MLTSLAAHSVRSRNLGDVSVPHSLRLKSLKLRNFKGIAELNLPLDESLTLLAGVNGVGKTSVIQALVAAVTHTWWQFSVQKYPFFRLSDDVARTGSSGTDIVLELSWGELLPVPARFSLRNRGLALDKSHVSQLMKNFEALPTPLPLVVYYEQNRVATSRAKHTMVSVSSTTNRDSSLHTTVSSPSEFKAWFFDKEADEGRETRERQDLQHEDPELKAIRGLLTQLDGFSTVRSRKPPESSERVLLLEKEGLEIAFDSLSGGEQAFFLLAADLARRLMIESPNTPLAEAHGIVCIDEIELHLHPSWQRKILKSLIETFPTCQFVVTTHSPQVIAGIEARHVRLLEPGENGVRKISQPIASKGHDSNYVLKGILDTPERDDEVSQLLAEFDQLADDGDFGQAERVLHDLEDAVEGQSSAVAIRQAKLNRLRRTEK